MILLSMGQLQHISDITSDLCHLIGSIVNPHSRAITGSSIFVEHVDNMVAASSNKTEMAKLKEELKKLFSLVDLLHPATLT